MTTNITNEEEITHEDDQVPDQEGGPNPLKDQDLSKIEATSKETDEKAGTKAEDPEVLKKKT